MIVVSNATPLIGLAQIGRFDLLHQLFGELSIAEAIFTETVIQGVSAKEMVADATWIHRHPVQDQLAVTLLLGELDRGEAETILGK